VEEDETDSYPSSVSRATHWRISKLRVNLTARLTDRVANTIRAWLDNHFEPDEDIVHLDRMEGFAKTTLVNNGMQQLSTLLLQLINRRVSTQSRRQLYGR
jgi:hypothetical protein